MMRKSIKIIRIYPVAFTGRFLCFFAFLFSFSVLAVEGSEIPPTQSSLLDQTSPNIYIAEGTVVIVNSGDFAIVADKHTVSTKIDKPAPVRSKTLAKKELKKQENPPPAKIEEPKAQFRILPFTPNSFFYISGGKNNMILPLTQDYNVALAILNENTFSYINSGKDSVKTERSSLFHILETTPGAFCTRPPPVSL